MALLDDIATQSETLIALRNKMDEAEKAFLEAKAMYENYAQHVLPDLYLLNGIRTLKTNSGAVVNIATKVNVHINKNETDKNNVIKWLRERGAGDLVKSQLIVSSNALETLKQAGIPYKEDATVNTNSVKAYLMDQLGLKEGVAQMTIDDIPKGINYHQYEEAEVINV